MDEGVTKMKLKNSLEEALYVLLILSKETENCPIKGAMISQKLGVSDSYLKKILRKLVISDMVNSSISKGGGFVLARPLHEISVLDVFYAIEGQDSYIRTQNLATRVYTHSEKAGRVENNLLLLFQEGENLLRNHLGNHSVADLLKRNEE